MRWKDLEDVRRPGSWLGIGFDVEPGEVPSRPGFRVECVPWSWLRITSAGRPVLWGSLVHGAQGCWVLHADADAPRPLPPVSAHDLRAVARVATPFTQAWWSAWAKWFARALAKAPQSPLHPGRWRLAVAPATGVPSPPIPTPARDWYDRPCVRGLAQALASPTPVWEGWIGHMGIASGNLVRAHRPSPEESDRVRAWRKRARDGTLPPVIALTVTGLDTNILLDGHDRLQAALLERAPAPFLVLASLRGRHRHVSTERQDAALREIARSAPVLADENALVIDAWDDSEEARPKTRAWGIAGGLSTWRAEVAARLRALGLPGDHPMAAARKP